ncbi:hypothetical protein FJU30_07970 [Affinibrenneria salicis]|uniref:DUF2004 domain-containing protein n=1 Tax=Affinibrenneria salicis TaxID=2590031 RepID=A0A5J5G331_9GAMM|nr:hypothetical protein [Affinibrenneria salicis]KAA9001172.1 hypothetical protein FJU30_07970 [Affinibrenneria salicis]
MSGIEFDQQDEDSWTCSSIRVAGIDFCLTLSSDDRPDDAYTENALQKMADVNALILKASALILENYSYQYFRQLGVEESLLLKEETPEGMSKAVTLLSVWFQEPSCENFELSFTVPWDPHHTFDVEFEFDEPTSFAVNG